MIRPARPDDIATIVALIKELATYEREPDAAQATETDLQTALFGEAPGDFALIAEDDPSNQSEEPQVAGFALWFLNSEERRTPDDAGPPNPGGAVHVDVFDVASVRPLLTKAVS